MFRRCTATLLLLLSLPTLMQAQEYAPALIASTAELDAALAGAALDADADRQAVRDLLARPEVERTLALAGTDREEMIARVELLEGERLTAVADRARAAEAQLAGGDTGIVLLYLFAAAAVVGMLLLIASADYSDTGYSGGDGTLPGNA